MRSRKKKKKKESMRKFKEERSQRVYTLVEKKQFKINNLSIRKMKKNNLKNLIQYLPGIFILIYVFFLVLTQFIK